MEKLVISKGSTIELWNGVVWIPTTAQKEFHIIHYRVTNYGKEFKLKGNNSIFYCKVV